MAAQPHAHYPPLASAGTDRPSASRWSIAPSSLATPPTPPSPSASSAAPDKTATLLPTGTEQARSQLARLDIGSSTGGGRGVERGKSAGVGLGQEAEAHGAEETLRYEAGRQDEARGTLLQRALRGEEQALALRGTASSKWAPQSTGTLAALRPPSSSTTSIAGLPPTEREQYAVSREGASDSSAGALLHRARALQARRAADLAPAGGDATSMSAAGSSQDAPSVAERDGGLKTLLTAQPATLVAAVPPPLSTAADAPSLADSPAAPSTSSLFSAPPSPEASRPLLFAAPPLVDYAELSALRARVAQLESSITTAHVAQTQLLEERAVRETSFAGEVASLRLALFAREADLRAAAEETRRLRSQLGACAALVVASEGAVQALEGQEAAGHEALELAHEGLALAAETQRAMGDAATRVGQLERELHAREDVERRMKGALLGMRRREVELAGRVRAQEEEIDALRAGTERHEGVLRRVRGVLARMDGDVLIEPVGDAALGASADDVATQVEAALERVAPSVDRVCPTGLDAATPTSSAASSLDALADEVASLAHANQELHIELAETRAAAERRIGVLAGKVDEITAAKDREVEALRRQFEKAAQPGETSGSEVHGPRRRLYTQDELLHLSQSPLVASSAPTYLGEGSLPPEVDLRKPLPAGEAALATARLAAVTAQHALQLSRVSHLTEELSSLRAEKAALEAHKAELEYVNAEAYGVMDALAGELQGWAGDRPGGRGAP
ncbi:hypothetical protein DMC30DRAFT_415377 [Rhodotorula diobovata]|uniref:Uncharacterized protein n=1 Tax=Rhodotorula diobovata TaxID=5288 RepID=A0A5C5G0Q7_9BASI|nr:hypothetical protein DMC30DRAFT_415377 [Rhodotorula diobovata]